MRRMYVQSAHKPMEPRMVIASERRQGWRRSELL
jgi:hypothetical protein